MKATIHIPAEPLSVNAMTFRDKRFKSSKYKSWETKVLLSFTSEQSQEEFDKIRKMYQHGVHCFKVKLTAYYNTSSYFTKSGIVSNKTIDCSNWEKAIVDLLFLPKYHDLKPPSGAPNINVDDRYIISLTSEKTYTEHSTHMIAEIEVVPAPKTPRKP